MAVNRSMPVLLDASPALEEFIKSEERLELKAYNDGYGTWTIGWGHTAGVEPGDTITIAQAEDFFDRDLVTAEVNVRRLITVPLTHGEFDTLVDFTWELGAGNLEHSALRRVITAGHYEDAPPQLLRWIDASGKPSKGVQSRRQREIRQFWMAGK